MRYRKKYEDKSIDYAIMSNDGVVIIYDDENDLTSFDATGKQVFKKHIGINIDKMHIGFESAYFYGYDDNGDQCLALFSYADKKLVKRRIPDIEITIIDEDGEEDEDIIFASDAIMHVVDKGYFIVYPNNDYILYDQRGERTELSELEKDELIKQLN